MNLDEAADRVDDLDRRVTFMEGDVARCTKLDAAQIAEWHDWRARWRAEAVLMRDGIGDAKKALAVAAIGGALASGAASELATQTAAGIADRVDDWGKQLDSRRSLLASLGCALSTPGGPEEPTNWILIFGVVGTVALLAGGGYAVYRYRTKGKPKKKRRGTSDED